MGMNREELHRLIEGVPESKWMNVGEYLKRMSLPEVEATAEELAAIQNGLKEFENGEFHFYENIEDLRKDISND